VASLEHVLAFLQRVPVMAGLAQCGGESLACRQPADVLAAADRLERADNPACYVKRLLVKAETAHVASHRVRGHEGVNVIMAEDPAPVLKGALVGLQGIPELAELPVVDRDVASYVQRTFVIYAENSLEFTQNIKVQNERLSELAACAQVRTVNVLAE
jgi:hypothetical protein